MPAHCRSMLRAQGSRLLPVTRTLYHTAVAAWYRGGAVGVRGRRSDEPVESGKSSSADALCAARSLAVQHTTVINYGDNTTISRRSRQPLVRATIRIRIVITGDIAFAIASRGESTGGRYRRLSRCCKSSCRREETPGDRVRTKGEKLGDRRTPPNMPCRE